MDANRLPSQPRRLRAETLHASEHHPVGHGRSDVGALRRPGATAQRMDGKQLSPRVSCRVHLYAPRPGLRAVQNPHGRRR